MIDYEKEFQNYISVWMKKEGLSANMYQVVDDHLDEIYDEWMHTPLEAFGGKMPHHFFDDMDSAESCYKLLKKYIASDIAVPGPLLTRIATLKEESYPLIIETLKDSADTDSDRLKTYGVELISEMDKPHPFDSYIASIKNSDFTSDFIEVMVDVLKSNAVAVKEKVIAAYIATPHEFAKDTYLDILSELILDADAYKYIFENFVYEPSKCGMYAHMLSKVGIADCVDAMQQRLADPDVGYLNFCRVKEALEELGAETSVVRDFSGDPDYEYIASLGEEEAPLPEEEEEAREEQND
ncbi:MAG: hypothetical protein AB1Z19_08755 [Eubacteriales bacterium]